MFMFNRKINKINYENITNCIFYYGKRKAWAVWNLETIKWWTLKTAVSEAYSHNKVKLVIFINNFEGSKKGCTKNLLQNEFLLGH